MTRKCCERKDAYQCTSCKWLFCSQCATPIVDANVSVRTIGSWFCDAEECIKAEAAFNGVPIERIREMHRRDSRRSQ